MLTIIRKSLPLLFLLLAGAGLAVAAEEPPITAVAATAGEAGGQISEIAARAPYFLFFAGERLLAVEKNPYAGASGGAGTSTADFLARKKVQTVIAGQFGPKMRSRLQSHNIEGVERQGKILDAVKEPHHGH